MPTIRDFIELINDSENILFSVFDYNTEDVLSFETDEGPKKDLNIDEIAECNASDYEIGGIDMWMDEKLRKIHIEFNIDFEEENEEDIDE